MSARNAAFRSLRGDAHTASRGLFMTALPKLGAQLHERLLHDLSRRVTQ
jgi:hypothetical protein